MNDHPRHPRGSRARVLLTSVFGPYNQDDEYGSRKLNPMELYHNQVTREQEAFSLRMFHRSWGILLIQQNIQAPCTLLDFPTRDDFIQEIRDNEYDVVGISSIILNVGKVEEMCRLVRRHRPEARIVIGGHIANMPDLETRIDADHIVQGEGVAWMRRYLGQDPDDPLVHPRIPSAFGTRSMGIRLSERPGDVAAALIPSVGCPMGCDFCSTSAMFGGKGKAIHFYPTGDDLFEVMCELEEEMKVRSFFTLDENFLLHRRRALRLLELMEKHGKAWSQYIFSSVRVLVSYSIEQLVGLGVSWVWMGIEGDGATYPKLRGADTYDLVRTLQSHGIRVLGSSIVGLDEHTPENIDRAIEYAVAHDTEFHQFMLFTPLPGTPLHDRMKREGLILESGDFAEGDIHGQLRFNYRHPHFRSGEEGDAIRRAFRRDFEANGPSIIRIARTMLRGWLRYKDHPDRRIRNRYRWECRELPVQYAGVLWAARHWFHENKPMRERISTILDDLISEFGIRSRIAASVAGRYIRFMLGREQRRLARGKTYEPRAFREMNATALALQRPGTRCGLSPYLKAP